VQSGATGGFQDGAVLATAEVDASGAWQLSVPPGNYRVFATVSGQGPRRAQPTNVALTTSPPVSVDLVVDDTIAGTTGTVTEPNGGPSGGASVALLSSAGQPVGMAVADPDGHFNASSFRGGPPASLRARNGGRIGDAQVNPQGGDTQITLRAAAILHGTLSGGDPPTNFTVTVTPADNLRGLGGQGQAAQEFTGASFDLYDVPGVEVTVAVKSVDGRTGNQSITLQPGQEASVTVTLLDSATITGHVLGTDGKAFLGASVLIDGAPRRSAGATSGSDGSFSVTGLAPGDHVVTLRGGLLSTAPKSVTLAVAQTLDLGTLTLLPPPATPGTIGASFFFGNSTVTLGNLLPGGPAAVAGLRENDVVLSIGSARVVNQLDAQADANGAPGTPVVLSVLRGGGQLQITVIRAGP
jgi:large repetitive protein